MAVVSNMRYYVPAPPVLPRYGLFTVANGPLDLPRQGIIGGLEYEHSRCGLPTGLELNCDTPPTKAFADGHDLVHADPFLVRSSMTCGAVGMTDTKMKQMLMDRLKTGEQAAVERIISENGAAAFGASSLQTSASTVSPDCTTDDLVAVIGALEAQFYSSYGGAGILHVPARGGAYLMRDYQLYRDGQVWRTAMGTGVSIGNYANESPAGAAAAAGSIWVYITGPVTIWRTPDSDVFIPSMAESLNRTTNEVTAQAEREYAVAVSDCLKFAAQAILCATA